MNRYELRRHGGRWLFQDNGTSTVLSWRHAKARLLPEAITYLKGRAAILEVRRLDGSVEKTYTFSGVLGQEPRVQLHGRTYKLPTDKTAEVE